MEPDLLPAPSHVIGPTWRRKREGGWWLPDKTRTIGDQVVNWLTEYVNQPAGPRAGQPFIPTREQFRFILWWYAIDQNGRLIAEGVADGTRLYLDQIALPIQGRNSFMSGPY